MQVGIKVNAPVSPVRWQTVRDMAVVADQAGLASVWSEDHQFGPNGAVWEAWTTLAAIAATTERVLLGPIVASTNFYPSPHLLARKAAALHEISGGRFIFGIGAGSQPAEYPKLGLPFDHPVGRFDEAFQVIRRLLAGERFSFAGRFHRLEDTWLPPHHLPSSAQAEDKPTSHPAAIPFMVGSTGPRMLSITLPHVDGWNVHWSHRRFLNRPEGFAALSQRVDAACATVGREPGEVWRSAEVYVRLSGGVALPMSLPEEFAPIDGSPEEVAEQLAAFDEVGCDHLMVLVDPQTPAAVEELAVAVQLLGQHVG
jgi:alkanesulfonate monooxygenase SsuD/methylene tetrahydromethanopterin reductase-like flavin-dependent oxidoreductase (luciferase family)